ncbi:MAG: T9SS type A sorting domain-containing protein [bacterium]
MKKHLLSFAGGLILMISGTTAPAQVPMLPQEVIMGPGYANEVYYQFTTFNTYETPRNTWDISFKTMPASAAILINDGTSATLWAYPYADTSGWAAVDTFDLYNWPPLYNDENDWENGAFNRNSTGYPDYGWGVYNPATQVITGDSIFIMQLVDGSFKKVWIVEKNTLDNTWLFRYANLDGSDDQEITLDCDPYTGKDMVGFHMQTNLPVNYQPVKESWDILFTRYMAIHPSGVPVVVTGVQGNPAILTKRFYPVDPEFNDWQSAPWDSTKSNIGWDWKWFDMTTYTYSIEDSMVFYVEEQADNVYRLKFTAFEGSSTGVIEFGIALVLAAGVDDGKHADVHINLWPNPATDLLNIGIETRDPVNKTVSVTILDMTGRAIRTQLIPPGQHRATWDIRALPSGAYLLEVASGNARSLSKFFVL